MNNISAIELVIDFDEYIDQRVIKILKCLVEKNDILNIYLNNIELVEDKSLEHAEILIGEISKNQIRNLLNLVIGGLQITDLDLILKGHLFFIRLIVRDGQDINIVTDNITRLYNCDLGKIKFIDPVLFNY